VERGGCGVVPLAGFGDDDTIDFHKGGRIIPKK